MVSIWEKLIEICCKVYADQVAGMFSSNYRDPYLLPDIAQLIYNIGSGVNLTGFRL
ncbi:MAG TPA: hypothetical protein VL053_16490 [Arachidicoccus sp.]|nr:hypothetical protein [Arachidicoccus sp.]